MKVIDNTFKFSSNFYRFLGFRRYLVILNRQGKARKDWHIRDKAELAIHNEQRKLRASLCNTFAGALVAVGFFGPATALYSKLLSQAGATGLITSDVLNAVHQLRATASSEGLIIALLNAGPYIVSGWLSHKIGMAVLAGVRSEGDIESDAASSNHS